MNFKKITLSLICGCATVAAMAQLAPRTFLYDGSTYTNGFATYVLNGDGPSAYVIGQAYAGTTNNNAVSGYNYTNASFLMSTIVNVASYVYISGNFGGTYTVNGIGAGYDPTIEKNLIEVATNRNLTFTATGFYPLANSVGSIQYTMSLLQDYPNNGNVIGGTGAPLTDAYFNGATLGLNATTSLPVDGLCTLQLTRQLTLTQYALGNHTYSAAGIIAVGVN